MRFLQPTTWPEALAARAAEPGALALAGGTDVMVELNFDRRRPPGLLDLGRVAPLAGCGSDGGRLRIGAGVSYRGLIEQVGPRLPGLALAARAVGSPQIRNRGTIGGNLGTASPAGDALPPLLAAGAAVEVASVRGVRHIPVERFCVGPRRTALEPDELIAAVLVPPAAGPQQFAKVGARTAMVVAICSFALALDLAGRTVGTGIGSAAPTPVRAYRAEEFLAGELGWDALPGTGRLPEGLVARFGDLVAAAAAPIDDGRASAGYRRHVLAVLARRTLSRAWAEAAGWGGR